MQLTRIPVKASDSTELSILGVDGDQDPSLTSFPSKFNQRAFSVWSEILSSPQYTAAKHTFTSRSQNWDWMIRTYLRMCTASGLFPFSTSSQQSNNDSLTQFLANSRRRAIKFFNDTSMFRKVSIFTTSRAYDLGQDHFSVVTTAILRPITDPTFKTWLLGHMPRPMFRPSGKGGTFIRELFNNVDSGVKFEVNLQYSVRPTLTFTVNCQTPIAFGHSRNIPTVADMQRFAESSIWLPLVRTHRFLDVGNRLF